jgi:hypothetical protein
VSSLVAPLLDAPAMRRYGPPELVLGASPAATTHFASGPPAGYWMRLLSLHVKLVTDANVAARELVVEYRDVQAQRFALYGAPTTVAASTTIEYVFSIFQPQAEWPVASTILVPLGPDLLYPGCDFRVFVVNLQATDAVSEVRFQRELFYPPDELEQPE